MVIVAFDPNAQNVIRQVYIVPKKVKLEEAEAAVLQAYAEAQEDGGDAIEILESRGYTLAEWVGVEVEDG